MILEHLAVPYVDAPALPGDNASGLAHLSLRLKTCRYLLATMFPDAAGQSLVDLGAGPGHFARIAARHGFDVTALDAREPWTLKGGPAGPPAEYRYVRCDLRDADLAGFDIVACIGVLYHLTLDDQRDLLQRCAGKTVIIDTELYDADMIPADRAGRFTALRTEGYDGALCAEADQVYSSHGNAHSFWFDEASILRFFADAGRAKVTVAEPAYHSAFGPRRWYVLHA